jgi:hypothetical protein
MSAPVHAVYSYGNPFAPMGAGGYKVELGPNGVVLTHQHHEARRTWTARADGALWTHLTAALESSGFPTPPSTRSAPPGTESFSLVITRSDGSTAETSGFPSMEYKDVSFLFLHVVSQMSKDAVLGFEESGETIYVTDVREG